MSAADIFPDEKSVAIYRVQLRLKHLIVGGIPSNPSVIRSWLTQRMEMGDAALEELLDATIEERNGPMTVEEKVDVLAKSSVAPSVNGFKRNTDGMLCYEGRTMKAALKEASNSAFPGTEYLGKKDAPKVSSRKGLLTTMVERVFVPEILIPLGVYSEKDLHPDVDALIANGEGYCVDERIKHVKTMKGPRSAITIAEVVYRPTLEFTVRVHDDFLTQEAWGRIWTRCEDIGIGSDRGRSDGPFDLLQWEKI